MVDIWYANLSSLISQLTQKKKNVFPKLMTIFFFLSGLQIVSFSPNPFGHLVDRNKNREKQPAHYAWRGKEIGKILILTEKG